ncbi:MAG TPA: hypothetical protein PKO06_11875 [Candidatus Ozemobacteraceae bacterium]|nr:hypothetical protein [Candidatus Ozemobacteraceae bacterium]
MGLIFVPLALMLVLVIVNVMLYLIARFGGWQELAGRFPERTMFQGRQWRFRSLGLSNWTRYNNAVTIGANAQGIRFSMPWFFAAGHAPFFISWGDIAEWRETKQWFLPVIELSLKGSERVITLPRALALEILRERPAES